MNEAMTRSQNKNNTTVFILVFAVTSLTVLFLQHNYSASGVAGNYIAKFPIFDQISHELAYFLGWGIFTTAIYLLIPLFAISVLKESPREYGLTLNKGGAFIYLLAPFVLLPVTYVTSQNIEFQNTYPFLIKPNSIEEFVYWELIYVLQFFALEFFFRGYLFHSFLRLTNLFLASVLASLPYMMIHIVKPFPETIASFFGGVFLCWLAFKYKNILIGLYLHIILAISMDIFALYHKGWFSSLF